MSRHENRDADIEDNKTANEIDLIIGDGKRAIVESQTTLERKEEDTHNNLVGENVQVSTGGSTNGDIQQNNNGHN